MSVSADFTRALPVTGIDTHVTISLPGRLTIGVEFDNWKLMLAWKPASSGPTGLTTLYHYHVRPFTALQSITSDLPAYPNPGESKIVHASGVAPQSVTTFTNRVFFCLLENYLKVKFMSGCRVNTQLVVNQD